MSPLNAFREIEQALESKLGKLESLKNNPEIKQEIDFEEKLLGLMIRYEKTIHDLRQLIQHDAFGSKACQQHLYAQEERSCYRASPRTYRHPVTGELLETRGKCAKLKTWEKKYGFRTVSRWLQPETL